MPRARTELERAAGKLVSAVQHEWTLEMGEPGAAVSEEVMHNSHGLLVAATAGSLDDELNGRSITDYLGRSWVRAHPDVIPAIRTLENAAAENRHG